MSGGVGVREGRYKGSEALMGGGGGEGVGCVVEFDSCSLL